MSRAVSGSPPGGTNNFTARVLITPQANEDLIELWTYVAEFGEAKATRLLGAIRDKCQLLAERPQMGRERRELLVELRSFPSESTSFFTRRLTTPLKFCGCYTVRETYRAFLMI